jgi:uncharacterized Zn-finger protein
MKTQMPEISETEQTRVVCDGGPLGHPKVYLEIGETGYADCPYCGRRFFLKTETHAS